MKDTKSSNNLVSSVKQNIIETLKSETVLIIAVFLAIVSSFFSLPKVEYIDFRVLILLFDLMVVVEALNNLKVLDNLAIKIINSCTNYRYITLGMVFITFFASMIVTNDVALITFIPLTIIIGKRSNINVMKMVIFQTLAANLGSAFTPMGNPQNLFLFTFYKMGTLRFFKITIFIAILGIIFLILLILKENHRKIELNLEDVTVKNRNKVIGVMILMTLSIMSVFHILDYRSVFIITILYVLSNDIKILRNIDYSLLITFIGFFIFVGNISNMSIVKNFMQGILNSKSSTYFSGILCSQVISNVPATMLLSRFTSYGKELLLGVNIGGMGTLIASLASVISYKLYIKEYKTEGLKYIKTFTLYNILGLVIFVPIVYFLQVCF